MRNARSSSIRPPPAKARRGGATSRDGRGADHSPRCDLAEPAGRRRTAVPDEPDHLRVARALHVLADLTRRVLEDGLARTSTAGRVTFVQVSILKWLDVATPRRAQDVAHFLSASAPAATQILARLRVKGLVRSRQNALDRRAQDLHVTARARKVVRLYEKAKQRRIEKLLRKLSPRERAALAPAIEAGIAFLMRDRPSIADLCLHCGVYGSPACVMRLHGHACPTERPGAAACDAPSRSKR